MSFVTEDGVTYAVDGVAITMQNLIERFCIAGTEVAGKFLPDIFLRLRTGENEGFVVQASVEFPYEARHQRDKKHVYVFFTKDGDLDALARQIIVKWEEIAPKPIVGRPCDCGFTNGFFKTHSNSCPARPADNPLMPEWTRD